VTVARPERIGLAQDLALAIELAAMADAISLHRFGASDLRVDAKPDMTPVTDADLAVERALRTRLAAERPADAVLGEEFAGGDGADEERAGGDGAGEEFPGGDRTDEERPSGDVTPASGRRWVIDPIDGTKNFVRGVPIWATLIALMDGGRPVLGVVSAPALARRWWAADGQGSFTRFAGGPTRQCQVSAVSRVADASLSLSDLAEWEDAGLGEHMHALSRACWRTRGYGDFYSYLLVAEGAVDIAAEPELNLWDLAALAPIVTEAGGAFSSVTGEPIGPHTASALATNGLLHHTVLAALSGKAVPTPARSRSDNAPDR
jgi:histidinol-phosphatase